MTILTGAVAARTLRAVSIIIQHRMAKGVRVQTASTPELELNEAWLETDPRQRVRVAFPINRLSGAEHTAVVYFEVAPGERLGTHTDSAEEILYIVAGEGEAEVGDERAPVRAGDLAVVPEMVPHGIVNTGDEPLKVVGFFCEAEITSTFEAPLQPVGLQVVTMGVPVPAARTRPEASAPLA
jgi:quercetin dioxygenase-like cupin family protein